MMKKSAHKIPLILMGIIFSIFVSNAQSTQFQPEKPGKFVLQNKLNKCSGMDIAVLLNKLTAITEWVRQKDSGINQPTGFDALVTLSGNLCNQVATKDDFGIQSSIYFAFHDFYLENGVPHTATGNTAHGIEFLINNPIGLISNQFTETGFITGYPPNLRQPLENALENLKKYYTIAPLIKEIAPGVRLYAPNPGTWFNGTLLVFNPDRPDIWIPVTVKEIMEAKLAYYKIKQDIDSINYEKTLAEWAKLNFKPDRVIRPDLYNRMKKEFENFTTEELSHPAYSSSQSGISTINAHGEGRQVMKFNPSSWDRALPTSAVQYISMDYRTANKSELELFKRNNDGLIDYVGLFLNALPVEILGELIQKK